MKILGIDISSRSTGWAIIDGDDLVSYGKIVPSGKSMTVSQRMYLFHVELRKLIESKKPDEIVIEDVIQVRSVSVLKLLARFNGIAMIEAYKHMQREPVLYEPSKWKSMMGCSGGAKKCEVQVTICERYGLLSNEKLVVYGMRIDEIKSSLRDSRDEIVNKMKGLKKQLKVGLKKKLDVSDIESELRNLKDRVVKSKVVDKKKMTDAYDKISVDIYTETGINEDIADAIGIAIARQNEMKNE